MMVIHHGKRAWAAQSAGSTVPAYSYMQINRQQWEQVVPEWSEEGTMSDHISWDWTCQGQWYINSKTPFEGQKFILLLPTSFLWRSSFGTESLKVIAEPVAKTKPEDPSTKKR